ncbi:chemotaxis response regulator protein-glutamate methylesterase [candidate division WOR-3 bacterium]|uniref:Protein-glutamate methylesterase/protein-glutamine glutaminase n=1 Tax=candidate division WOR-3 bacterium TaxID=2052148 RepID=A0A660SMK8_UNCW3|nr:MAG: chemotaxis response regulator protein-glutamate methylesterase [candidate division WOR-3 bacterium]
MIRVLVVDDSILMVKVISDIINSIPNFKVCATARSAKEAVNKFVEYKPDLVSLDFELPDHDGLWVLERIFEHRWVPVVMVSAHTREGAEVTLRCLELGAVDFITKPSGTISLDLNRGLFAEKLNQAIQAKFKPAKVTPPILAKTGRFYCVGIGSSTGGVRALMATIPYLPDDFPGAVMIVQHMPKEFTASFAERLNRSSKLKVSEARGGEEIREGQIFIAPGGFHMIVKNRRIQLTHDPPIWGVRPAIDCLLPGIADNFTHSAIGVILTGMGRDGSEGIKRIKEKGGRTIAEDPRTAFIGSMPQNAIKTGCIDYILPLGSVVKKIVELVSE